MTTRVDEDQKSQVMAFDKGLYFFFSLNRIETKNSPTQIKSICPSLTMANLTDDNLLFSYFSQKGDLKFHANCLLLKKMWNKSQQVFFAEKM